MPFLLATAIFSFFLLCQGSTAQSGVNNTFKDLLILGVPTKPFSSKFVHINRAEGSDRVTRYTGFSIMVFEEVQKIMKYKINYKFVEFNGSYDDLVASVANKTFDGAIGDITITAKRWELVDFTVPYTESGLSMVVPLNPAPGWILFKPFTAKMWIATLGIMVYTMFVVWFFEHRSNTEFGGSWHNQLGNALWFTFTSLFFAHREMVKCNHTRVAVVVWLFLVLILTQSYTASLSSWLTVARLNSNVDLLRNKDAKVGCNPFMETFVEEELKYESENIKLMRLEQGYLNAFKAGNISAALLEIPYAKLLVNGHCKEYAITGSSYRFGGLGFIFQKDSEIASHVSKAILELSETGTLKRLEESWITSSSECSVDSKIDNNTESLSFQSFMGLYLFSAFITTLSFLVFIARLLMKYHKDRKSEANDVNIDNTESLWNKTVEIVKYLKNTELGGGGRALKNDELGSRGKEPSSRRIAPEDEIVEESETQRFQEHKQ